jgi:hypothetical protein
VLTTLWEAGLLAGAAIRVLIALLLSVGIVPLAQVLQYLLVFCPLLGLQFLYVRREGLLLSASAAVEGEAP